MCELYHFPQEMQPARPYPPPGDPRHQDVVPSAFYAPEMPTDEELEVLDVTNGLYNLIQKYGADRVMTWVRSMASIAGQEVS